MAGRAHLYEGYAAARVTYGVRALRLLGVRSLVLTNAAGGINLSYGQGALVLISDHINLQGTNPLIGANEDEFGPRFPDMSEAYSVQFREIAKTTAAELGVKLEGRHLRGADRTELRDPGGDSFSADDRSRPGRDVDGAGSDRGESCGDEGAAISCVTNMAAGVLPQKINHEEVLETGAMVRDTLIKLMKALLPRLDAVS